MSTRRNRHVSRNLLHRDKLDFFKHWVSVELRGEYRVHPHSGNEYEVFRIEKISRSGSNPHIVFYLKLPPTQHVTLCKDGEHLVQRWLRIKKTAMREETKAEGRKAQDLDDAKWEVITAYEDKEISFPIAVARMKELGFTEKDATAYLLDEMDDDDDD